MRESPLSLQQCASRQISSASPCGETPRKRSWINGSRSWVMSCLANSSKRRTSAMSSGMSRPGSPCALGVVVWSPSYGRTVVEAIRSFTSSRAGHRSTRPAGARCVSRGRPHSDPLSVEDQEEALTAKYVRENLDGRLASRHFRNQLVLLSEEWDDDEDFSAFLEYAAPWLPEIRLRGLDRHQGDRNTILDLYYVESGRRTRRRLSGLETASRFGCSSCCMFFACVIEMWLSLTSRTSSCTGTFSGGLSGFLTR